VSIPELIRHDQVEGVTYRVRRRVPEQPLGAVVPCTITPSVSATTIARCSTSAIE
jgi:hypothetical protein